MAATTAHRWWACSVILLWTMAAILLVATPWRWGLFLGAMAATATVCLAISRATSRLLLWMCAAGDASGDDTVGPPRLRSVR